MNRTNRTAVSDAHRDVTKAEQQLAEAQQALEDARNALDVTLAQQGWRPLIGALNGEPLYTAPDGSGDAFPRSQVVDFLMAKETAA